MTHHKDHDHHHDHHHHEHHHQSAGTEMTTVEKAVKILDHWVRHNEDHAKTYREWADRLTVENLADAAALLNEAADMSIRINEKFQKAGDLILKKS